jgi:hypothetical protein
VSVDSILAGLLEEGRKFGPHIFEVTSKLRYNGLFFGDSIGDALKLPLLLTINEVSF